jgi:hypothetical protein
MIAFSVISAFQRAQRSDHLGSSNVSYRADGQQTIIQRYHPWGNIRPGPDNALPTDYTFTGQKLDESTGLMYYGARYYDPYRITSSPIATRGHKAKVDARQRSQDAAQEEDSSNKNGPLPFRGPFSKRGFFWVYQSSLTRSSPL